VIKLDDDALNIVVDGSSLPGPRRGGIGVRVVWVGEAGIEQKYDDVPSVAFRGATNNQMELLAPISGLKLVMGRSSPVHLDSFHKVVIHTDSRYLSENIDNAKFAWRKSGWRTRDGSPVLNQPQWKELIRLIERLYRERRIRVDVRWVRGKSDEHTKAVDKLAKRSARSPLRTDLDAKRVRRKKSPREVEPGCVRMRGQEEVIRIVTDKALRSHKMFHYIYEVMDRESPDHERVDKVFSHLMLSAGHISGPVQRRPAQSDHRGGAGGTSRMRGGQMDARFRVDPLVFMEGDERELAKASLTAYFSSFTGSKFEELSDWDSPNEFTARDILAVSTLSVTVPANVAIWLVGPDGTAQVRPLLEQLGEPDAQLSGDTDLGPAYELWDLVRSGRWPRATTTGKNGVGRVIASKLLAAKRPGLIPIYDRHVAGALFGERDANDWEIWRSATSDTAYAATLEAACDGLLQETGRAGAVSVLRCVDIVVWMRVHGYQFADDETNRVLGAAERFWKLEQDPS